MVERRSAGEKDGIVRGVSVLELEEHTVYALRLNTKNAKDCQGVHGTKVQALASADYGICSLWHCACGVSSSRAVLDKELIDYHTNLRAHSDNPACCRWMQTAMAT